MFEQMKTERQKVIEKAWPFAPLLSNYKLSEEEIDAVIGELRPLRHHIRAIDYGSVAGFRDLNTSLNLEFESSN